MRVMRFRKWPWVQASFAIGALLAASCSAESPPTVRTRGLTVGIMFPAPGDHVTMGETEKAIVSVLDEYGTPVDDAEVTLTLLDPTGQSQASAPAAFGDGDVYRTEVWSVPHRMQAGEWTMRVEAKAANREGTAEQTLLVQQSTSEVLLEKYGFWVDAPDLRGVVPILGKERGDASNGVIIWGGLIPAQHIFPENWLEVHWRKGEFSLNSADDVRAFMLEELGDLGFTPLRAIGRFERARFKDWDGWKARARGQFTRYDMEWIVFYAPEVDKTFAISTMLVQAPIGIDAHAALRDGFEVHPEVHAEGQAPDPLVRLLPAPEQIAPELGAEFFGTSQPVTLRWKPVRELAEDEYYRVSIDYNYIEANPKSAYSTRNTEFTLPEELYWTPNCAVFNWRVTLMRQTGTGQDGEPTGDPLSYMSLYWYVKWQSPPGEQMPFDRICPNPQE